jgi:hypothetical protein
MATLCRIGVKYHYWVHSWLGYTKGMSSQNHSQNSTLNDHYIYQIIYLVDFSFPLNTHILFDKNGGEFL